MKYNFFIRYKNVVISKSIITINNTLKENLLKCNHNMIKVTIENDWETIYLDIELLFMIKYVCEQVSELNLNDIKESREYLFFEMLESLSESNLGFIDFYSEKYFIVNFTEIISGRNLADYKAFLMNYETNPIVCFFALRDMIENLKVYLYLLRAEKTETIIKTDKYTAVQEKKDEDILKKKIDQVEGKIKMNFDFSKIIKNTPTIEFLSDEFSELDKINMMCNDWIHKNGYEKINVKYFHKLNKEDLKNKMYYILKIFFTVVCCYDEKSISGSDYFDAIENNEVPPAGSEAWIAPIFQEFIDKAYTTDEKKKIEKNCYMEIN
ncbi:MAG: hypothetical protein PHO63_04860 [Bacilli bacterium]|nr:hypothetical protein [Bacilli bacterium]MDD4808794.1 hypothetical protein [Bacilli bacterium]